MKFQTAEPIVLPPDGYDATCTEAEYTDSLYGPEIKFVYRIDTDQGPQKVQTWAKVPERLTPRTKLAQMFAAHFGRPLSFDPPEAVELDDLVGCRVRVLLEIKDGKDGNRINSVVSVSALPKSKPAPTLPLDDGDPYVGE